MVLELQNLYFWKEKMAQKLPRTWTINLQKERRGFKGKLMMLVASVSVVTIVVLAMERTESSSMADPISVIFFFFSIVSSISHLFRFIFCSNYCSLPSRLCVCVYASIEPTYIREFILGYWISLFFEFLIPGYLLIISYKNTTICT